MIDKECIYAEEKIWINNLLDIAICSEQEIANKRVADVFNYIERIKRDILIGFENTKNTEEYGDCNEVNYDNILNDMVLIFDKLEELKQRLGEDKHDNT